MRRRPRPTVVMPLGVNLADFDFVPDANELLVDRIRELQKVWIKEDDKRRRQRAAIIAREVEADRRKQAQEDARAERQEQVERERAYWSKERKNGAAAMEKLVEHLQDQLDGGWRKKALLKLDKLTKEIARDKSKAEKELLLRRGVLRGRR